MNGLEAAMTGRVRKTVLGLAVLLLAACKPTPPENYYDVAPEMAFQRLAHADIKGFRDARQCGLLIYFTAAEDAPHAITWTVTSGGVQAINFTVRLVPSGKGTIITIEVPKTRGGGEFYDSEQTYKHPVLMQPLRPAVRELINAAIEGRAYDWQRIAPPINSGGICGSMAQNFIASGIPYDIHDPFGMTHAQAEEARQRGDYIPEEPDPRPGDGGTNPWAK